MDFGLGEEQRALQDNLRRLLRETVPVDRLRELVAAGPAHDQRLWRALADMGLTGVLVPEEFGGLGLGLLDAVLVQEVLGEYAAPVAWLPTAIAGPLALTLAASTEQKARWFPAIVDGTLQVAVGIAEAGGNRDDAAVVFQGGTLRGRLLFVQGAAQAQLLICCCSEGDLYAVHPETRGLTWTALRSIDDTRALWEVNLEDVEAEPLACGLGEVAGPLVAAGRVALAADTLGAAQSMLDRAVAYAGEREQFGRPVGSFQAVKHLCADMAAELEPARALLWYAAHVFDAVPAERRVMACHAKAHLSEVGTFVARSATEVHGGVGFTELLGLHYWFKRIGCNRQLLGGPERLREEASRAQGWGRPPSRIAQQGGGYR